MKNIVLAMSLFLFVPVGASAGVLFCRVDSFSADGSTSVKELAQIDDSHLAIDFIQHRFEVELDKAKGVLFFHLREVGGTLRASGISPMPNSQGPFLLKYVSRMNTDVFNLKCFNPDGK